MKFPTSRKLTACVLAGILATSSVVPAQVMAADDNAAVSTTAENVPEKPPGDQKPGDENGQPPAKPGNGGADTMTYDYTGELSGVLTADGEEVTSDGKTLSTETKDQNVGLAQNGGSLTITDGTLTKSGADTNGDNCNFYGINSILLSVNDDSVVKVSDSTMTADSTGSNAVFATDNGTAYVNNSKIITKASNSRGLDATYGGTVIGNMLSISTAGNHSAALATDRGGGNISATNSSLATAGSGSPLLYSTGNVQVDNVEGEADGSQIAGMEGLNTILIKNSTLTSNVTGKTASDPVANGVIIYQSTSGDAESSTGEHAEFEVENSTLKSAITEGSMFYLTNTTANIVLKDTTLDFDSSKADLLNIAGNDANNWGSAGKNGANVTFTGLSQDLEGDISVDTISSLDLYLLDGSSYTGATEIATNANGSTSDAPIAVSISDDSTWTVTADSTVSDLHVADGAKIVDADGNTVKIVSADGKTLVDGDSDVTVTVNGTYDTTVTTSDANSLNGTVINRSDFDVTYGTTTTFGDNEGADKNTDVEMQEPSGGDDAEEGGGQGGEKPPTIPDENGGQSVTFNDVATSYWAYDDITSAAKAGIMTGTGENTFSPETTLTRGMIATILYRLEGEPDAGSTSFTDINTKAYYASAVSWAEENGIVSGYGDGTFGPNNALTREQLASVLFRYATFKKYDTDISADASLDKYSDSSKVSNYSTETMTWAVDKGYIAGTTSTTLSPQGSTTRAQAAAIIMRFLKAEDAVPSTGNGNGSLDDNGEPQKPEGDQKPGDDASGNPPAKPGETA
ncbi:MAG: S-layer homology domain-containing protein [Peptococcaceae bacterium]|nr:S-layer homology domain-containing protein [Peptococcaceae bacterium]